MKNFQILKTFGLAAFIALEICTLTVMAAPPAIDYSKATPVVNFKKGVPVGTHPTLKELDSAEFGTKIFYSGDSIIKPNSDAVFIMFAGTGARTASYGVITSYKSTAQKLLNFETDSQFQMAIDILGPENILYDREDPENYATSRAQVDSMVRTLNLVTSLIPRDSYGRLTKKIVLIGRSTGAAVSAQLLHEAYIGRPGLEVVNDLDLVMEMGLLGHNPDEIVAWDKSEREYLSNAENAKKNVVDPRIQPLGKKIFEGMSWGSADASPYPLAPGLTRLPKVIVTLGSNDFETSLEKQIEVAERFSRLHPKLSVLGWGMDTEHNPAATSIYPHRITGTEVTVEAMKRFSPLIEGIALYLSGKTPKGLKPATSYITNVLRTSGTGFVLHGTEEVFNGPSIENCEILMERFGQNVFRANSGGKKPRPSSGQPDLQLQPQTL